MTIVVTFTVNAFAMYIVGNGIDAFHEMIDRELKKELSEQQNRIQSRTAQPSTVRKTIKGDGKHTVSYTTYGLVELVLEYR